MEFTSIATALASLVSVIVVPFLVQAIRTHAMSGNVSRFVAIAVSILAGVVTGFVGGVPSTAQAWLTVVFAVVGGIQVAYSAFRAVGVTSAWLDALLDIGSVAKPTPDTPETKE